MSQNNHNERRTSPRVQASLHLHIVYEDLDQLIESYSRDISEGGVFVETDQPLPVGSRVHLKISLVHPEIMYVEAMGEVVHAAEKNGRTVQKGMGVRFISISPPSQRFIREFVLSRLEGKETKPPAKKPEQKATQKKKPASKGKRKKK